MKKLQLIICLFFFGSAQTLCAQTFEWVKKLGGSNDDLGYSVAVDGNGNVYTTGSFSGTADFDPGAGVFNLTSVLAYDIFVSKLDASGNFVWAKSFGGTSDDYSYSIALDGSGNAYTTGSFDGTADFDPGAGTVSLTSAGGLDGFISKLDVSGNFIWAKQLGGTTNDQGNCITLDGSGNVHSIGYFEGTADFDPGAGTFDLTSAGGLDGFISKLDASGNFIWAKQIGGISDDRPFSIALGGSGNLYTTGSFEGTADFDPGAGIFNLTSSGSLDVFITKLDASGNFDWAKTIGGTSGADEALSVTVDGSGNVYTTGSFEGTADFDPDAGTFDLTSAGSFDIFVHKMGFCTTTAATAAVASQPNCITSTGSITLSGLPTSGTWTVNGTPGGTATGNTSTTTISSLAPGNYTFTVTFAGCTSSASNSVTISTAPIVPTAPIVGAITQPTCSTPTGSVELSGLPASGSWTVTASPGGATATATATSTTFSGLTAGNTYTFTVTNSQSCTSLSSTGAAVSNVPSAPAVPISGTVTQPTCVVPTGSFDVTSPLGTQYTYSIDGTNFQASPSFTGLAPGSYIITVLDNASGCSTVALSSTIVNPISGLPVITLVSSSAVTCNGDTDGTIVADITGGTAPFTFSWSPNVGIGLSLSGLSGGDYTLSVIDDDGCSVSETFTVAEPAAIAANGTVTNVICGTNAGSISTSITGGTAPYSYDWTPNGETSSALTGLAGGNYGVTVIDDNGCSVTNSFTVNIAGALGVNVSPSYSEVSEGETVQLTAAGGESYIWTPAIGLSCTDCPNPVATATQDIVYYVIATDDNGCTGSDSAVIVLKLPCGEIYVPTAFSPNGKGPDANNELCVYGTAVCVEEFLFQVYDRWGEKVFETTDITKCWDGKHKGKEMNSGIYVYRQYVKLTSGEEIDTSGNTTLVR